MTNIKIASLPKNIQTAIHQFEQIKSQYLEQQERLSQLSQRMEKHRKAAEATMTQAEQFGAQWREIFRKNDGELTKEIRTLKTSEQESRDFSEEYNGLADALLPEFELCQLDTHDARLKHLESAKEISTSYTNHVFTAALNEILSSSQVKLFLISLKIKFDAIEREVSQDQRIYVGAEKNETLLRQARFLRESLIESIDAISDEDIQTAGFGQFISIKTLPEELVEVSNLVKLRRRNELTSQLN